MCGFASRWMVLLALPLAFQNVYADPSTDGAPTAAGPGNPSSVTPNGGTATLSPAQIDQMLAPIALYSDAILAQTLIAATYPLDIVEANRWNQQHAGWSPDALEAAAANLPWDPSVKALLPFGQLLALLDQNIGWTEQLGEAFLAQRADVAEGIQRLRQRATATGTLQSTPEQQVSQDGSDLVIAPTNTDVVYVPVYQPEVVYAPWPWPDQMPYVLDPPPGGIWVGPVYWCTPVIAGAWLWGGWNWRGKDVQINLPHYNHAYNAHLISPIWGFSAARRRGVPFHLAALNLQFRQSPAAVAPLRAQGPDAQRVANTLDWRAGPVGGARVPPAGAAALGRAQAGGAPAGQRSTEFVAPVQRVVVPPPAAVRPVPTVPITPAPSLPGTNQSGRPQVGRSASGQAPSEPNR